MGKAEWVGVVTPELPLVEAPPPQPHSVRAATTAANGPATPSRRRAKLAFVWNVTSRLPRGAARCTPGGVRTRDLPVPEAWDYRAAGDSHDSPPAGPSANAPGPARNERRSARTLAHSAVGEGIP